MRARFVYTRHGKLYRPVVAPTIEHADPKQRDLPEKALFVPARTEPRHKQTYLNFTTGKMSEAWVPARRVPDGVNISGHWHPFEHGVCRKVRVMPDEHIEKLAALDEQIETLKREREETLEDAYIRGRPLRPDDIEAPSAAYRAALVEQEEKRKAALAAKEE